MNEVIPAAAYRIVRCGPSAVLVELDRRGQALSLALHLRERVEALDVVPAATTVLVDGARSADIEAALTSWVPDSAPRRAARVEIPVVYDGEDLADVAAAWGCSAREVVARHTSLELVSVFCGFAPGFAYLAGLPEEWALPRLREPRARVPAGSVALADTWCAVYPGASPGGWRLIGRTRMELWDLDRDPPALLAPGTRVRFREVGQ